MAAFCNCRHIQAAGYRERKGGGAVDVPNMIATGRANMGNNDGANAGTADTSDVGATGRSSRRQNAKE
ncbi:MAG: hypothetical protein ACUVTH_15365 [Thermogutta sp.]